MLQIRNVQENDYTSIIAVINDWWGGRPMADMLPKLFFIHFQPTSFIAEEHGEMTAFLVGFLSQTFPGEAYIHFVGVHPDKRKDGVGRQLYQHFFETVKQQGCHTIRCITSPVNKTSISFHTKLGFAIEQGDKMVDGISVSSNYDGRGNDRVVFVKEI
ncbi:GNAT family N-acetyltransferase [Brevibacillus choshinensis]|uniref:GNAT family N-acetyltransferase n=1 Tax=Brevibacillus choshinensis TaxID=54911 RepID=UPI002E1DF7FF|nr:GNAT family N-acetyltransferase [Brevibacillus choshinensis]MED4783795.1 GNAT family N-acetyltransferase [Brevibacillus choshinensis]